MYNLFKRLLDILVSLITLIILIPLFIPIIIILRFSAEGEVFYFQERYGINNSSFYIWKFATMLKNSMNLGTGSITLQNDPRVTKIGSFLSGGVDSSILTYLLNKNVKNFLVILI